MSAFDVWTSGIDPDFVVATHGPAPTTEVTRVVRGLGRILRRHGVEGAVRARLDWSESDTPTLVQIAIRPVGRSYRVQVAGPGRFAVTFALERLDLRLGCAPEEASRPWPDPARPTLAMVSAPRPIVRHKDRRLQVTSAAQAARILDAMDYDAHLFTDADTGTDAVVCWTGPLGVRILHQHDVFVPMLSDDEAAARLCVGGLSYLFFTHPETRRGQLLYRRFDGDLGLVRQAAADRSGDPGAQSRIIGSACLRPTVQFSRGSRSVSALD
ncbi:sigma 54 modulation/S30EA ribosomal C-terminal domain-containing protein [Nocardia uniformis]|uniref:sigma 54 modulation/S30EA ribosomal C-terminal domain-containing protein n=1 Tax=Nocardia uniformis TaxID=53432 RepID=UPI0008305A47|nr:sigma 54 modulation/S30EA ribosomal C-terminal domain-containing protein [Nocardia uniformis]